MRPREDFIVESDDGDRFFGHGPCRLLRAVSVYGSLYAAASSMKMAYTKATRLLHDAEKALGYRLVGCHSRLLSVPVVRVAELQ